MEHSLTTCALVATSSFNAQHFQASLQEGLFTCVVAVDGGYRHLQAINYQPQYALGDFDSLGYVPTGENVEVHSPHKDESDLELSLRWAQDKGFAAAVVYGALGGRLDHTLASLQTCARFAEAGMEITLIDESTAVRVLVGPALFTLPFKEEGTVSVFSATDESLGVSEWGMEYPLHKARLTNRTSLGLSNELIGQPAGITIERGTLYVFYPLSV